MKEYKDYMSRISGGPRLRDKIMNRIAVRAQDVLGSYAEHSYDDSNYAQPVVYNPQDDSIMYAQSKTDAPSSFSYGSPSRQKAPKKRSRALLASLGLVACAAGILFGLLIVPMLLNRPADIMSDNGTLGIYYPSDPDATPGPAPSGNEADNVFHFNFYDNVSQQFLGTVNEWDFEVNVIIGREYHSYAFPAVDFYFDVYFVFLGNADGYVEISATESPPHWHEIPWPVSSRSSVRISNRPMYSGVGREWEWVADGPDEPLMSYIGGVPVMIKLYNWPGPNSQFYGTGDGQSSDYHNYRTPFPIV